MNLLNWHQLLIGKLSWSLLPQSAVAWGGASVFVIGILSVLFVITYFKFSKRLWNDWLTTVDAKKIGLMYLIVSFVMFVRGLSDALLMRAQQATALGANSGIISAEHFQQVFSAHGSIMIFFVAMGIMFALINLIVPLQIGARDVAFPFLNSLSFWLFASGAVLITVPLVLGDFSGSGWLAYPPLSELQYSPSVGVDYWIWSLQISGIGTLLSGINFTVTILRNRCKGMTMFKMPMFTWTVLGAMVLVVVSFPLLTVTLALLALDRTMDMHFFTTGLGGNMMMYVNLIWAWGHPEVYILTLPAFGIFSEVVAVFSGKKLAGYISMVLSVMAIVVLSFVVWLHHFFTMGAGANVNSFFGIMTAVIAIPTGVKIFNWLFTMYRGKIRLATPMLWFVGFVVMFTLGGVTGVIMAPPAADYQLHNTLFLVAHFHSMIVSGVLFGYFAGITYWLPKILGFKLNESLGKKAFWGWLYGFILAFGPLYVLGFMGVTRRLDHYTNPAWQTMFIIAGIGVLIIVLGVIFQVAQFVRSVKWRNRNLDTTGDPWNGRTLEWSTPSPAPEYNFAILPEVDSLDPFWKQKEIAIERGENWYSTPKHYEDILMPKNTILGLVIAGFVFVFSFGVIWHMWILAGLAFTAGVVSVFIRVFSEDTERVMLASAVEEIERKARRGLVESFEYKTI